MRPIPLPVREAEVLVVGAGLIGASVAFTLRQAGHAVSVLDADLPGAAWRAGAGVLSPAGEGLTPETPLGVRAGESLRSWPAFARRLQDSSGQSVHFRAGVHCRTPDGGWTITPGEGQVHPPSVVRAALHGLPVWRERVRRLESRPGGVSVFTDQGEWRARRVVLAAGAWSAAFDLPVTAVQGQALLFSGQGGAAEPVRYAGRRRGRGAQAYTLSRPDGVYVGATVRSTARVAPDARAQRWLWRLARHFDPALASRPEAAVLVGLRPVTPDGLPIVGPHPGLPAVIVATGHGRHGALLAPWTAAHVLHLLQGAGPLASPWRAVAPQGSA